MELKQEKYRGYKDRVEDDGREAYKSLGKQFFPDFYNRNTIQLWDVSAVALSTIERWVGATLADRSLHEVTIVNNSNNAKKITFANIYSLLDETEGETNVVNIGPQGSAHFYCTSFTKGGNLFLAFRTGSQDNRKL